MRDGDLMFVKEEWMDNWQIFMAIEGGIVYVGDLIYRMQTVRYAPNRRVIGPITRQPRCDDIRRDFTAILARSEFRAPSDTIELVLGEWPDLPIEVGRSVLLEFIDDTAPLGDSDSGCISFGGSVRKSLERFDGFCKGKCMVNADDWFGGPIYIRTYAHGLFSKLTITGDSFIVRNGQRVNVRHGDVQLELTLICSYGTDRRPHGDWIVLIENDPIPYVIRGALDFQTRKRRHKKVPEGTPFPVSYDPATLVAWAEGDDGILVR
jgi:hypothetical protein